MRICCGAALAILLLIACSSAQSRAADADYQLGKDSLPQPGVTRGVVAKHRWESQVFAGTVRDYWIYVPAQYDGKTPAAVMVFQDGHAYIDPQGQFRVPVVFDNLIRAQAMPVTIGVFINPGHKAAAPAANPWKADNRSVEYDTLSDTYARMLIDEILPEVGRKYRLTDQAAKRAICGISSGGICAFTVAWERPDVFSKVLSHVGSFTNIRGGHVYPALIRKSPRKSLRIFLQDGSGDLDNAHGNWWLSNQQMAAALKFSKYDHLFVSGTGGHSGVHGGAILPESLRWLWRTDQAAIP